MIHEQQLPGAAAPRFGRPQVEHGDRHAVGAVRSRRDSHRTRNQKGGSKQ